MPVVVEKLAFPLILGLGVAAFGWFFGPHLTNAWQDRQHNFSTKSALIDELSESSAELMSAVQTREFDRGIENDAAYLAAFRTWDERSQVIDAKIATYLVGGQALATRWRGFANTLREYDNLPDEPRDRTARQDTLLRLTRYVGWRGTPTVLRSHPTAANQSIAYQRAWVQLKDALIARRDALVAQLLRQPSAG
jgi:hypothetical protein